ncbi:calumenin-A-like [Bolinopsis microptera]|uniref:calumenin-A-like n=1 Tax=Bolinopsis microptera TaxID=2820187 RepID=UPI0030792712
MLLKSTAFLALFVILVSGEEKHRENIVDKERRHHENEADVDHEAFLGKDHGHDYDDMDEDESKAKLAALLPKVDADGDGDIDETELKNWIKLQIMDYVQKDAQNALPNEDTDKDGVVTWEEYVTNTFGEQYLNREAGEDDGKDDGKVDDDDDDDETYARYVKRDKQRFQLADQDDDMKLTFEEFTAFLHPEEFEHMADVVIAETMEDMDENQDGKISLSEYVGEMENDDDDDDDEDGRARKKSFQEKQRQGPRWLPEHGRSRLPG